MGEPKSRSHLGSRLPKAARLCFGRQEGNSPLLGGTYRGRESRHLQKPATITTSGLFNLVSPKALLLARLGFLRCLDRELLSMAILACIGQSLADTRCKNDRRPWSHPAYPTRIV